MISWPETNCWISFFTFLLIAAFLVLWQRAVSSWKDWLIDLKLDIFSTNQPNPKVHNASSAALIDTCRESMVERHGDRMDGPLSLSLAGRGLLTLPDLSGIHSGSADHSVKHRNEFQENMLKTRIINQKQVHRHKLVTVGLEKIQPLSDLSGFGTQQSAFFFHGFFQPEVARNTSVRPWRDYCLGRLWELPLGAGESGQTDNISEDREENREQMGAGKKWKKKPKAHFIKMNLQSQHRFRSRLGCCHEVKYN